MTPGAAIEACETALGQLLQHVVPAALGADWLELRSFHWPDTPDESGQRRARRLRNPRQIRSGQSNIRHRSAPIRRNP
jgi:hypothetical protein